MTTTAWRRGGRRWARAKMRGRVAAAALLVAGCRTAPVRPERDACAPAASAETTVTLFSTATPALLIARHEFTFLVIDAGIVSAPGGEPKFQLAYLASLEASAAQGDNLQRARRTATTAAELIIDVLMPFVSPDVRVAEVTAIFGAPGTVGLSLPVRFTRTLSRWSAVPATTIPVIVPPLPTAVGRSVAAETAAVEAARRFLERVDEGDYDGAWELASAALKVGMSRDEFVERLRLSTQPVVPRQRRERFSRYEPRSPGLRMGDVLEVCFDGPGGIDAVQVRLDDDQEWRVALVSHVEAVAQREGGAPASAPNAETRL